MSAGIAEWSRLDPGALELTGDAFRMMYGAHPAIEGLHALRDSLGVIVRNRNTMGRDGRNRPSLFPFGTATGRNAQAKSLYNTHAGMRSLMKFPAGNSGLISIGEPRRSALPPRAAVMRRWRKTISPATSITLSRCSAA